MKKLMFAAAVAASMVAFGDITSANVVGYESFTTQDTLGTGYNDSWTKVGLAFDQVGGGTSVTIDTNIFNRVAMPDDKVVIYNPEAMDYETYSFLGYDGETSNGWNFFHYNDEWKQVDDKIASFVVNKGEGVMITPWDYSVVTMTTSGQVADTTKSQQWVMPVGAWTQVIMNPYPINTTFKDLESFAQAEDVLYVVNPAAMDCDTYSYLGAGNGWYYTRWGDDWEQHDGYIPAGSTEVILPAGGTGYYVNYNLDGRTWTVTLEK